MAAVDTFVDDSLSHAIEILCGEGIDLKVFAAEYEAACKSTASDAEVEAIMRRVHAHVSMAPRVGEASSDS